MGPRMALMSEQAKGTALAERAGALLRVAAPGLVPAGGALALVGLVLGSYGLIVAGLMTAIVAVIAATEPPE